MKANLLLGFSATFTVFALLLAFYGYEQTWELWGIVPFSPYFADVRVITAGVESHAQGYDPLIYNPADPWHRRMNYPRIWQSLYLVGLNQSHTLLLGIVFIILFFIGVYIYLPNMSAATVCFLMAAIWSPAILLGIERGNIDLLMFFLLSLSVVLVRRHYILSTISIMFAFLLKLFPVFGLSVLLCQERRIFIRLCIFSVAFASLYVLFTFEDLRLIYEATPKATLASFGVDVFWMRAVGWMKAVWTYNVTGTTAKLLSYFAALLILLYAFSQLLSDKVDTGENDVDLNAFRTGSSVYIGTFMLGNNWDYRLMFLLFAIPQLLSWARHTKGDICRISRMTLIAIYISFWDVEIIKIMTHVPFGGRIGFVLDELCNWLVFYGSSYLFFLSVPEWLRQYARQLRSQMVAE